MGGGHGAAGVGPRSRWGPGRDPSLSPPLPSTATPRPPASAALLLSPRPRPSPLLSPLFPAPPLPRASSPGRRESDRPLAGEVSLPVARADTHARTDYTHTGTTRALRGAPDPPLASWDPTAVSFGEVLTSGLEAPRPSRDPRPTRRDRCPIRAPCARPGP